MEQQTRVEAMERIMDQTAAAFEAVGKALDTLEENGPAFRRLRDYYGSEEWFRDVSAADCGMLKENTKCGVLSEDAAYDLIGDSDQLAIRMLEVAARMLRERS